MILALCLLSCLAADAPSPTSNIVLSMTDDRGGGKQPSSGPSRPGGGSGRARELSASDYGSIQEAIDSNPGRMIYVPAGDYKISAKLRLRADHSGLFGPGRITQTNPNLPIIEIENASGVQLRDLALARPQGKTETTTEAVLAIRCRDLILDNLQVYDNRTSSAAIALRGCEASQVRHCLVQKNDLWSIGLMPGASSQAAALTGEGRQLVEANVDGGSIIANNIISDFGYGNSHWIWGNDGSVCCPIRLDGGQKPENPPLADVVIQGNMVYDTGRDQGLVDGTLQTLPPRYKYAVLVVQGTGAPRGVRFFNNIFHSGTDGISNVDIGPQFPSSPK